MEVASNFLSCAIKSFPFIFLGLPIGANPRRRTTWDPIMAMLCSRILGLKVKSVSLGGRFVLLNFVLSSIPLFFFSFYRALKVMVQEIIKIQWPFLWVGEENKRIIN